MNEVQGTRHDGDRDWWPRAEHVAALIAAPFGMGMAFLADEAAPATFASTMVVSGAAVAVVIGMRSGPLGAEAPNWMRASLRALILSAIAFAVRADVMVEGLTALLPRVTSPSVALPLLAVGWIVGSALQLHLAVAVPIALREDLGAVPTLRRVLALTRGEHVNWMAHTFAAVVVLWLPMAAVVSILDLQDRRIATTAAWVLAAGMFGPTAFALHERLLAHEGRLRQHLADA